MQELVQKRVCHKMHLLTNPTSNRSLTLYINSHIISNAIVLNNSDLTKPSSMFHLKLQNTFVERIFIFSKKSQVLTIRYIRPSDDNQVSDHKYELFLNILGIPSS